MSSQTWQEYYFDGKMIRRDDTPISVLRTLEDWSDSTLSDEKDPMWQFAKGKPVEPLKLQRAIRECIHSNRLGMKEQQKLLDLEVWAIRESALAEAAKTFRQAQSDLQQALATAGIDPVDFHTPRSAAA